MPSYYETNIQYLLDELKKLDLLIQIKIARMGQKSQSEDMFKGLYISEEDVSSLLEGPSFAPQEDPDIQALADKMQDLEGLIEGKVSNSQEKDISLNLPHLKDLFSLTEFEFNAILICAIFELDTRYERLYAYLQDDLTRKYPSPGLILNLLCRSPEEMIAARQYFLADHPLIGEHILEYSNSGNGYPLLSSWIKLNSNVLEYILGQEASSPGVQSQKSPAYGEKTLSDIFIPEELRCQLQNLLDHFRSSEGRKICCLQGPYGAGKKAVAEFICDEMGAELLAIDLAAIAAETARFESLISSSFRDALLWGSAIYLDHFDALAPEEANCIYCRNIILKHLQSFQGIVFISSRERLDLGPRPQKDLFKIELPVPDYTSRKQIWQSLLGECLGEEVIDELATKFQFTAGQIKDALLVAENLAILNGRRDVLIDDIYDGCRAQSNQKLTSLARRIKPSYTWNDIVLPKDKIDQLKDVKNHVKHKGLVYHNWGFESKLSLGKGLNILFVGPSGTGKTMAAEVIAHDLDIDLYKIDLSTVVSKYIGETEKNLSRIFKESEQSNAMLFFDEADALFGKRSEVKDSHDRYANIEISYLLQKMEEHQGIVILASNLGSNIDDAFMRRMNFVIDFPFPEEDYRCRIWRGMMPEQAPVANDIDFEFLARRFKIAGGNIKSIVINAAFSAAEDSGTINMAHIINATRRELQKMGKAYCQSDFGKYYDLIKND